MKEIAIKKRSGKYRHIVIPDMQTKAELRQICDTYARNYHLKNSEVVHGFVAGKNAVTNARAHVGYACSLSYDISDFFDSVTAEKLKGKVSQEIIEKCLYQNRAAQGLPTSPFLSNVAAQAIDDRLMKNLKKMELKFVYTRYADDITISLTPLPSHEKIEEISKMVMEVCNRAGFRINKDKTKIQYSKRGKREICGVLAGDDCIRAKKYHRRKLRALKHLAQSKPDDIELKNKISGLEEWIKLKTPKTRKTTTKNDEEEEKRVEQANDILRYYHLRSTMKKTAHVIEEMRVGNMYITTDPRIFALMSTVGNSWTSCMSLKGTYKYRRGVTFWQRLRGAAIAYIASDKTTKIQDFETPLMSARALVFMRRDGKKVFSRIYGGEAAELETKLRELGFVPAGQHMEKVVGNVPSSIPRPYIDRGKIVKSRLVESGKKVNVYMI